MSNWKTEYLYKIKGLRSLSLSGRSEEFFSKSCLACLMISFSLDSFLLILSSVSFIILITWK